MKRVRTILLAAVLGSLALPAFAAVKVYEVGGDLFTNNPNQCPPNQTRLNNITGGETRISDMGTGTVTLLSHRHQQDTSAAFDSTANFGPGAFIFVDAARTDVTMPNTAAPGSTASGGIVVWGIVTGWSQTGAQFCLSSPTDFCGSVTTPHGATVPATGLSPTYDIGTWSFDAEGDYNQVEPYLFRTTQGGVSNAEYQLRGTFVGASLPALPLLGLGALGLALAAAGARALRAR